MSLDRQILRIAIPSIISNITVPLLSLVDLAIVGHLGSTVYMAAIPIGGMVFNVMYWIFGFIRMGTSGLTAQAYGRRDLHETARLFTRASVIALACAIVLMILQWPIYHLALWIMAPEPNVEQYVSVYFNICIWGAPPSLLLFALSGWFLGMQDSRTPMTIAISQNVVNILASLFFVYALGMKVEGVALGTLIAQYLGLMIAIIVFMWRYRKIRMFLKWSGVFNRQDMRKFFLINRDIFFRTVCLVAVFLFFTAAGSWQGATLVAVNAILLQFPLFFSYIMDGFAFAGEALAGKFHGAGDMRNLRNLVNRLFFIGGAMTVLFTLVYVVGDKTIISLLTDENSVIQAAQEYVGWIWIAPVAGVGAFVWDGIFVGITASRGMLVSSAIATALFFLVFLSLYPFLYNHALWLAFTVYYAARGLAQTFIYMRKST